MKLYNVSCLVFLCFLFLAAGQLTLGAKDDKLTVTARDGEHNEHVSGEGIHTHEVLIPEKMRSMKPGDRVLVAWVHSEAVVVDIIERS